MLEEVHRTLAKARCHELAMKSGTVRSMLKLGEGPLKGPVRGLVQEGIAREFIREFLPQGFGVKCGLVYDGDNKLMSPQIDALVYRGVPLLDVTDVVIVEKQQTKAIFEVKTWINQTAIFGPRGSGSGLAQGLAARKPFLPTDGRLCLFAFTLWSNSSDEAIVKRLGKICDCYAIVTRMLPSSKQKLDQPPGVSDFDSSVSRLIHWLRNLDGEQG